MSGVIGPQPPICLDLCSVVLFAKRSFAKSRRIDADGASTPGSERASSPVITFDGGRLAQSLWALQRKVENHFFACLSAVEFDGRTLNRNATLLC